MTRTLDVYYSFRGDTHLACQMNNHKISPLMVLSYKPKPDCVMLFCFRFSSIIMCVVYVFTRRCFSFSFFFFAAVVAVGLKAHMTLGDEAAASGFDIFYIGRREKE